jgi:hypothetical protein
MCGTAEATKDHLNEHSLLEQPAWLPITIPGISDKTTKGIDRQQNPVCVESVWCVSYGSTMLWAWNQSLSEHRGGINTGPLIKPYVGDVRTMSREA